MFVVLVCMCDTKKFTVVGVYKSFGRACGAALLELDAMYVTDESYTLSQLITLPDGDGYELKSLDPSCGCPEFEAFILPVSAPEEDDDDAD